MQCGKHLLFPVAYVCRLYVKWILPVFYTEHAGVHAVYPTYRYRYMQTSGLIEMFSLF